MVVQEARHNSRILHKVALAQPFAAAARMIELGRMYDNIAQLLLYYSKSLLPLLQEIILFEVVRFLLVSHVRHPPPLRDMRMKTKYRRSGS